VPAGVRSTGTTPDPAAVAPALLHWFRAARRPLPWRRDRDPYRIWVAEVLLQQTRVAQAAPYFERFVRAFPTIRDLAAASEAQVLKVWQGAGYYARARNLRAAAIAVVAGGGELPRTEAELRTLPGVGPYIASAVASLAFDEPVVALEANGLRVAARWTRTEGDVRTPRVRSRLGAVLAALLPPDAPGAFNEAVMELGETICLPRRPRCVVCPVAFGCRAFRELPDPGLVPSPRRLPARPLVRAAVVVLSSRGRWLVQRRPAEGLLGGLWEFPGGKIEPGETARRAAERELAEETGLVAPSLRARGVVRHAYSHFRVELHVFTGTLASRSLPPLDGVRRWVTPAGLARLPLPKATERIVARLAEGAGRASPGSGSRRGRTPPSRPGGVRRPPGRARAPRTAP
jgi:A/G-specific adenine glycosylase